MRYQSGPVILEEIQETTRERAARQRRERQQELRYTANDERRWAENRERVLRERQLVVLNETSRSETIETSILKSTLLKNKQAMNALGRGELSPLSLGMKSAEVKMIQEALMALDFDLGASGADGDFCPATNSAIKQFQRVYEPSHGTHESYQFGEVDGIVGKNTILALDEAVNESWKHINAISHENCDCELSIDHEFIGILEGSKKNGYVPMPEKSKSGVTIAVGFDLGARNIDDLRNLGLSNDLIERFTPYLGLKKLEAKSFLESHPLSINDQELETIVKLVKESETEKIVSNYNKYSSVKFECLPKQAQTVIASVAYQYGHQGVIDMTPNFWKQAINQDWEGMFANLMKFYDETPTRRRTEAKLIKELIE